MLHDGGYDFSFSGLKTSVLYFLRKNPHPRVEDVCASFQEAVVDVLVGKTIHAATDLRVKTVSASGGASINSRFREKLGAECGQRGPQLLLRLAALCTDNAAMIASLAYCQLLRTGPSNFSLGNRAVHWTGYRRLFMSARLIVADSEHDANMLYATRMFVPDPFIWFETRGKSCAVMSDLEIDRARREAHVDRVVSFSRYQKQAYTRRGQTTRASAMC